MKTMICFATILLSMVFAAGCSKDDSVKPSEISITSIATGAKTTSGKRVDAYEVQLSESSSIVLIVGGGKLETSNPALLTLDGQMLAVDRQAMNNTVLILDKKRMNFITIPNVTAADAKSKCTSKGVIDLPIEETLAARPPMP